MSPKMRNPSKPGKKGPKMSRKQREQQKRVHRNIYESKGQIGTGRSGYAQKKLRRDRQLPEIAPPWHSPYNPSPLVLGPPREEPGGGAPARFNFDGMPNLKKAELLIRHRPEYYNTRTEDIVRMLEEGSLPKDHLDDIRHKWNRGKLS